MLTWATQTYGFLTECARPPLNALTCPPPPKSHAHAHTTRTALAQVHLDAQGLRRQAKLQVPRGPLPAQEVCGGRDRLRRHQLLRGPQRPQAHRPDRVVRRTARMYDIKAEPEVATRGAVATCRATRTCVRSARPTGSGARKTAQTKSQPVPLLCHCALSPTRRMVPHVFGWFTMTSVWFILFTQLEHARRDIHEVSDRNIPEWVFAAIIGTSLIFMSFALCAPCSAPNRHPTPSHPPPNHAIPRPDGPPTPRLGLAGRKSSSNVALCHSNPPNQIPVTVPFTLLILVPCSLSQASAPGFYWGACTRTSNLPTPSRPLKPQAQRARACAYVRVRICVCVHGSPLPPPDRHRDLRSASSRCSAKLYLGWFLLVNVIDGRRLGRRERFAGHQQRGAMR